MVKEMTLKASCKQNYNYLEKTEIRLWILRIMQQIKLFHLLKYKHFQRRLAEMI